jgi:hypothetical protein
MRSKWIAIAVLTVAALGAAPELQAQQDGLIAYPDVYRVQFENDWVRLIRVNVPAGASLGEHTHPPGVMVHVYFNDADPIIFEHDGSPGSITRPYVTARSYRVGRARPETHAVINRGRGASDYMRIELKTSGDVSQGQRVPAPPLGAATKSTAEITNAQYRVSRITVAAKETFEVVAEAAVPAILIALTDGVAVESVGSAPRSLKVGEERFVDVGRRELVRNNGAVAIELLRVDFLTPPLTRSAGPR